MSNFLRKFVTAAAVASLCAGHAAAQLLPSLPVQLPTLPSLPAGNIPVVGPTLDTLLSPGQQQQLVAPSLDRVEGLPGSIASAGPSSLLEVRRMRLRELVRSDPRRVEMNRSGEPVRRSIVVAINPAPGPLQAALRAGFRIVRDDRLPEFGLRSLSLATPRGISTRDGLKLLAKVAPSIEADYDHLYEPAGGELLPFAAAAASQGRIGTGRLIGMIDGGVASHPSLAAASIEQNGFAGAPQPTGHGTAVASLIAGNHGPFRGAAPGVSLLVADVYGGSPTAGSATAIARALAWLAARRAQVINVSLAGPENKLVGHVVRMVQQRGIPIVAAVGNDGPAAPAVYPASYPGVVAVTAVDSRGRALPEAGKAEHLDFAAPGADMAAALPGQGYAVVRGTSFAAPLAASRLIAAGSVRALAGEARPGKGRVGRGIVCSTCRVEPKAVGAK